MYCKVRLFAVSLLYIVCKDRKLISALTAIAIMSFIKSIFMCNLFVLFILAIKEYLEEEGEVHFHQA